MDDSILAAAQTIPLRVTAWTPPHCMPCNPRSTTRYRSTWSGTLPPTAGEAGPHRRAATPSRHAAAATSSKLRMSILAGANVAPRANGTHTRARRRRPGARLTLRFEDPLLFGDEQLQVEAAVVAAEAGRPLQRQGLGRQRALPGRSAVDQHAQLGRIRHLSAAKARRLLGWTPRGNEEIIVATAESLLRLGLVKP